MRATIGLLLTGLIATAPLPAQDASPSRDTSRPSVATDVRAEAGRVVEPPSRAFGLVIGDVVSQRLQLSSDEDWQAWHQHLPEGRVGPWFERRPLRETSDAAGRRWLSIDYQIVNAPETFVDAALPPIDDGGGEIIGAWPIRIAALTPLIVPGAGDLQPLRPIPMAPPIDTTASAARMRLALLATAAVLLAWLAWLFLRTRGERDRLPFAAALHALKQLPSAKADDDPRAWRALHGALDRTAGKRVTASDLVELYARAPWLAPFDDRLVAFLQASNARFFTLPPVAHPYPVTALGHALFRAERSEGR